MSDIVALKPIAAWPFPTGSAPVKEEVKTVNLVQLNSKSQTLEGWKNQVRTLFDEVTDNEIPVASAYMILDGLLEQLKEF